MDVEKQRKRDRELIDSFCNRYFTEENIRNWCRSGGLPAYVIDEFYQSGLGVFALPKDAGGMDAPFIDRVSLITRMTRKAGATLPFLADMTAYAMLSTMRTMSQQEIVEEMYPSDGRVVFSQAFTEPGAGTDDQAIHSVVSVEDGKIFLDGEKTFVSSGQFLPQALVLVRDPIFGLDDSGLSLWLVPISAPGVSTFPLHTVGQEMICPARIKFDHVELQPYWQIQTEGKLDSMLKRQYALGRILVSASSLGLATAAMDDALAEAALRKAKGRALYSLPQIQEKLVDMAVKLDSMRKLVKKAAIAADKADPDDFALACAIMKYYVPRAATEVASDAMQIFGGKGYTDETRVSRIWQDCRGNQIAQGTDEVMVHVAAKLLVKKADRLFPDLWGEM